MSYNIVGLKRKDELVIVITNESKLLVHVIHYRFMFVEVYKIYMYDHFMLFAVLCSLCCFSYYFIIVLVSFKRMK